MAIQPFYKVVIRGEFLGEEFRNILAYRSVTGAGSFSTLGANVISSVVSAVRNVTTSAMVIHDLLIESYDGDGLKDGEQVIAVGGAGIRSGEPLPPYAAWGFRKFINLSAGKRHGSNRFAGISENDTGNGQPTGVAGALLLNLANALKAVLGSGAFTYQPVVAHYDVLTKAYSALSDITAATFRWVTTQNSRKFGQ